MELDKVQLALMFYDVRHIAERYWETRGMSATAIASVLCTLVLLWAAKAARSRCIEGPHGDCTVKWTQKLRPPLLRKLSKTL